MRIRPATGRLLSLLVPLLAGALVAACASEPHGGTARPRDKTPKADGGEPGAYSDGSATDAKKPLITKKRRVFTHRIETEEDFAAYSKEVGGERFTKFIIDLKTDDIYYFDVNVYKIHTEFIFNEIYRKEITIDRLRKFNKNYDRDKPEFLLCYLVHHLKLDVWTMAFWEGDLATAEHVRHAYKRLSESFYVKGVYFRPDSTLQEKVAAEVGPEIAVITNDKLYKDAEYQLFNGGASVGRLRLVPPTDTPEDLIFAPEEIVILSDTLPDITVVSGIISETFSTPLAHVSLRAKAWGIPNVGLKGAAKKYKKLIGKKVYFDARDTDCEVRLATKAEIAAWETKRAAARTVSIPPADLGEKRLLPLTELSSSRTAAYGAKTANLGTIASADLPGFAVPAGFGIPIHYYRAHLERHGLHKRIDKMMKDPKFKKDAATRKEALASLREAIMTAELDKTLLAALVKKVRGFGLAPGKGVFVRSSTNAEDLPGFNGAGLYDTVPNVVGDEALANAVRKVWASVWNLRAFEEREFFGIDHRAVYGAVLVQVGVDATAAGVLITSNIFDKTDKTTYTINAKSGLGIRVVEGKKIPESLLFDYSNLGIKVLSRSDEDTMLVFDESGGVKEVPNPHKGKPILTDERAYILAMAAKSLVEIFPKDKPLDVEWLFVGDELHIVQARPYVVPGG